MVWGLRAAASAVVMLCAAGCIRQRRTITEMRTMLIAMGTLASSLTTNPCILTSFTDLVSLTRCQSVFYLKERSIRSAKIYNDIAPDNSYVVMINFQMKTQCPFLNWPNSPYLTFSIIKDKDTFYCALTEKFVIGGSFLKGWAMLVTKSTPEQLKQSQKIHIQAPHVISDTGTDILSAHLFAKFTFQTLLISTRHRHATQIQSSCITPTKLSLYSLSDPCHHPSESFHVASKLILARNQNDIYIQMHVKSNTTCKEDIFVSTGIGKAFKWLYLQNKEWPIVKFVNSMLKMKKHSIGTPYNSDCVLAATKNILGRVVNGMKECDCVNDNKIDVNAIKGNFIHIEQSFHIVNDLSIWENAISKLFSINVLDS